MSNKILQVKNVSKAYTDKLALDNVSLEVEEQTVYGLLGPNGAGKTTLIRIINHITAPDSGEVDFMGHRLTAADTAYIGYLPEERGLYKKMKVGEQALFFARLKGLSKGDATRQLKEWFERFGISDWWNKKVEELSKGMAQKVQFIVTVLHRPKLLIFDEPFSGFDPINAGLLRDEIIKLKNEGATVIFSTHNMASVEEICDNITLINQSRNILTGNVAKLRREYAEGRYNFTFTEADPADIMALLQPIAGNFSLSADKSGRHILDLRLNPGNRLKEAIEIVNNRATLLGVNESTASMNDIFIHAVNESNSK